MCPRRERFRDNSRRKNWSQDGTSHRARKSASEGAVPQVDPSDDVPVNTRQIAEGAQRVKSTYQTFGPFRFHPARHLLLEGETLVRLGSRALEILAALVERPGELVTKDELTARVWPNTIVEESNLKVNVAALRRALGEGRPGRRYIATVSGRGYRFVAPVELSEPGSSPVLRSTAPEHSHNLPVSLTRTIGRADAIDALLEQLPRHVDHSRGPSRHR